jgi:Domain of unknown function (DUF4082)/Cellulase (glycosyl hydrolase family 5)
MSFIPSISAGWLRLLILALAIVASAVTLLTVADTSASGAAVSRLHVSGNRILDKRGRQVLFMGINRSGAEYACAEGWGIFDGPNTPGSVQAIASWHVNVVRVLLNEDCWLGINRIKSQYAGANYRQAIVDYVGLLHRYGMYAEVSLYSAAPGSYVPTSQPPAPDEDHAPAFWAGVASTFSNDPNVILAPWSETTVNANCFLKGGCEATLGPGKIRYRVAGMQQAVTVMRRAGYRGIIAIPGIDYSNDLSQWLSHMPRDPRHQLIAEAHVYGGNNCDVVACFQATYARVAHRVPLVFGEVGESYTNTDCGTRHISTIVDWADAHRVGYEAWAWDTWGNCAILIRSYAGQPFSAYGAWIRSHYLRRRPRLIPADTIFDYATPTKVDSGDGHAVTLGVVFKTDVAGSVTGVRFYKARANTGTHIGSLWTTSGMRLASATFTNETASGWQEVSFSNPVNIRPGTDYIVSYYAPNGHYSFTSKGLRSGVDNPPLHAIANTTTRDGLFAYGKGSTFPTGNYNASNYWVDPTFVPNPNASLDYTIFDFATPQTVDSGDGSGVTLGVKFTASISGSVTGIRFYKAPSNTGTHVGALWDSSGNLLASATFANETASGWQYVLFSQPVPVTAGTTYVASYFAPYGHYSATSNGFSSAFSNPPLQALAAGTSPNGIYSYGSSSAFPNSSYNSTNYWVDVLFSTS